MGEPASLERARVKAGAERARGNPQREATRAGMGDEAGGGGGAEAKKEIFTYEAPWTTYSLAWCRRSDEDAKYKMAIGSYKEEYSNQLQIVQLVGDQMGGRKFRKLCEIDHPYPATKVMWAPASYSYSSGKSEGGTIDLLATTGDYLRLWTLDSDNKADMKAILNNNKHTEYCAPLTSFDWSETDPSVLGTCSIDTTCTIWDVNVSASCLFFSPSARALPAPA